MSLPPSIFDFEQLKASFPSHYLDQGARYFNEGRVSSADYNAAQDLVTGRVRDSGRRIYQCIVRIVRDENDAPKVVGQCSCRIGYNCQHVAAVLCSMAGQRERRPAEHALLDLPLELRKWLGRTKHLADQVSKPASESVSKEEPQCVVYLLRTDARFGLRRILVRAVKVRRLSAGGYGKATDFNILGRSTANFVTRDDHLITALLGTVHDGNAANEVELSEETGADVLRTIAVTGRGHWREPDGPVLRLAGAVTGRLVWHLDDDARLRVVLEAERPGLTLIPLAPPWYLDMEFGDCGPLETGLGDREAALLAMAPEVAPDAAAAVADIAGEQLRSIGLPLPPCPERRRCKAVKPVPCLRLISEDLAAADLRQDWHPDPGPRWAHTAAMHFDYDGAAVNPHDDATTLTRVEAGVLLEIDRDRKAEAAAVATLKTLGLLERPGVHEQGVQCFELRDDDAWLAFIDVGVPQLTARGWRIALDADFRFRIAPLGEWLAEVDEHESGHWLDLGLGVEVDGERMDLLPLLVELLKRFDRDLSPRALAEMDDDAKLAAPLDDGRFVLMPVTRLRPILSTLVELYDPEHPLAADGRLRLSRAQAPQLSELEEAEPRLHWRGGEDARAWGRRLKAFDGVQQTPLPAGLVGDLRPYQRQGLDWLQFLREFGLGGILADDMGLGKTVQALAHLLVEKQSGRADRPSLVVAPTSLMFNWRREAERFAPSLRVLVLQGARRRELFDAIADHDLVLTTYPLLPRDLDALSAVAYHLLILDEAQAVKNPRSKAAQAVRGLDVCHRLCLTGTPLENHLGELWSLLDFLLPDLLWDERRFRRLFRTPIERFGDTARQEQLRRRVAPFLLRRTKEAVAAELPPKTEILREVPLDNDQRDLYETLRLALHEKVRKEVERKGLARSGIIILDALLKLRQVCCDPRLVPLDSARRVKGSAKLELLMGLVPKLLEEGRRILLFSQFTSMLELIEAELMLRGMRVNEDFIKLTGRTRNRALPVDRFQSGEVPLFLISLKAGGSGLNLTAADTVIHYDPWWNPAVERQATDRAHRIGQDKPVFVYKLLTEGTVEQKVAELQARKQALADAMLAGGGAAAGSLSAEDLELLFSPVSDE